MIPVCVGTYSWYLFWDITINFFKSMDSNKTIYPGMPAPESGYQPFSGTPQGPVGTFYPNPGPNNAVAGDKPLVGFLYSVSKTLLGEFWPLRAGSNIIGRSMSSSVCLKESTVSDKHANLVVRQMHNEDGSTSILAFVQDLGSTCGTMVNGVSLGFDPKECKNGDVITVGESYELYFILIDRLQLNLSQKENFIPSENNNFMGMTPPPPACPPFGTQIDNVGVPTYNNTSPFANQKSTIYMPHKK